MRFLLTLLVEELSVADASLKSRLLLHLSEGWTVFQFSIPDDEQTPKGEHFEFGTLF